MMPCGKSNKVIVLPNILSEPKKLLMVLMLMEELKLITLHALTLLPELKSVLKLTSEIKPILHPPLPLSPISETDNMMLLLMKKLDTTTLSKF